ncbi:hypothetical protein [Fodinicola acaciae]|uniref:hypothetical protein n=1 Tax=Fodinicola acaciae TaxID=2681555 RepID=UPI0013D154B3|nr:hypothetical protein [Fodinicola acaciae]
MTIAAEKAVAEFDSASAMLRAVSRALRGEDFAHLGQDPARAAAVRASAALPLRLRQRLYALAGGGEGVRPDQLASVDMSAVAHWITGHYPENDYPGAVIGSSSGSIAHVCVAAGVPWLPQTLLVPVHATELDSEDAVGALEFGRRVAPPLLENNDDVILHQMHDGNQDRLMASRIAYFRLKWRRLPRAYEEFLGRALRPGAPVVVVEDGLTWPTTRVDDRHVFQTGAYGGLSAEEFLHGSPAVTEFLRRYGSRRDRFAAPEPDGASPEAEWGFEPELARHIEVWGRRAGHPVVRLSTPGPQDLSAPIADLLRQRQGNRDTGDLLVESFVMLDPVQADRTGLTPFWSVFGSRPCQRALADYVVKRHDSGDPVRDLYVLLFPNGVHSAGAAGPRDWSALAPYVTGKVRFLRGAAKRWPAHFDSLGSYGPALRSLPSKCADLSTIGLAKAAKELSRRPYA